MERIILSLLLLLFVKSSIAQSCRCYDNDRGYIFKKIIAVCGTPGEPQYDNSLMLSELTVINCSTNDYLVDTRADATETFIVRNNEDSLVITSLHLLPDSTMHKLMFVPLSYQTIKLVNGKPKLSSPCFAFTVPVLTQYQRKYINGLCKKIRSGIKNPAGLYPYDETSVYGIFLGALTNCNDCYDLFINLDKYYVLDGAIAETKAEIFFHYIISNIKK